MTKQLINMTLAPLGENGGKAEDVTSYKNSDGGSFSGGSGTFYLQKPGAANYIVRTKLQQRVTLWEPSPEFFISWDGTAWVCPVTPGVTPEGVDIFVGAVDLFVKSGSTWQIDFRPSKVRVVYFVDAIPGLSDFTWDLIISDSSGSHLLDNIPNIQSGVEYPLSAWPNDIYELFCVYSGPSTISLPLHTYIHVTAIDFLVDGVWKSYLYYEEPT